jgi:hypothetical protein
MDKRKELVALNFSSLEQSSDVSIEFAGHKFNIIQRSADYDLSKLEKMLKIYDGNCDGICLSGLPVPIVHEKGIFYHQEVARLKSLVKHTPLYDGNDLKTLYVPWAFRKFYLQEQAIFGKRKIAFLSAAFQYPLVEIFNEYNHQLLIADAYLFAKIPLVFKSKKSFDQFLSRFDFVLKRLPLTKKQVASFSMPKLTYIPKDFREFAACDVLVGNRALFELLDPSFLKDKILITDVLGHDQSKTFSAIGVRGAIGILDSQQGPFKELRPSACFSLLEAMTSFLTPEQTVNAEGLFKGIQELGLAPSFESYKKQRTIKNRLRFAGLKTGGLDLKKVVSEQKNRITNNLSTLSSLGKNKKLNFNGVELRHLELGLGPLNSLITKLEPGVQEALNIDGMIIKYCQEAYKKGASILALPPELKLKESGKLIAQHSPIPITDGKVIRLLAGLKASFQALGKQDSEVDHLIIYGASAPVGQTLALLLAPKVRKITLLGVKLGQLLQLQDELLQRNPNLELRQELGQDEGEEKLVVITQNPIYQGVEKVRIKKYLDYNKLPSGCVVFNTLETCAIEEDEIIKRPDCLLINDAYFSSPGLGLIQHENAEAMLLCEAGMVEQASFGRNIPLRTVIELQELVSTSNLKLGEIHGHSDTLAPMELSLYQEHAKMARQIYNQQFLQNEKSNSDKSFMPEYLH